jgi:DNA-binding transcriptional ArsR family regulator
VPGTKPLETLRILTGAEAIDAVKALNDDNRRQILHALRARRMSTSELVDFLNNEQNGEGKKEVKPQTVRYHLKELEKCGLIQLVDLEPAGNGDSHIMQKVWRATAENVFIATGNMDAMPERESYDLNRTLDLVGTMKQLGMVLKDETEVNEVAEDFAERDQIYRRGLERANETLREACELDPKLYVVFRSILSVVRLDEPDYKNYWDVSRRITDVLRDAYRRGRGKNPEVY